MFTWICPKCGAEVPPSYNECPNCAAAQAGVTSKPVTPSVPAPSAEPAVQEVPVQVPAAVPPPPPQVPPPPQIQEEDIRKRVAQTYAQPAPSAKKPMPAWMVSLITVAICGGALATIYFLVLRQSAKEPANQPPQTQFERPAEAGTRAPAVNPFVKNLEATGFRITEDKKQNVQIRFLVVNHGNAELPAMRMQLDLKATGRAEPVVEVPFDLPSMAPLEVREVSTSAPTKLRAYELPDWQFLKGDLHVLAEK